MKTNCHMTTGAVGRLCARRSAQWGATAALSAFTLIMGASTPAFAQDILLDDAMQPITSSVASGAGLRAPQTDDAIASQPETGMAAVLTIAQRLTSLTPAERADVQIELEPMRSASAAERAIGIEAATLWNSGQFDSALARLEEIKTTTSMALGISRLHPAEEEGGIAGFSDTTIGADDATGSITLDIYKTTGALYAVVEDVDGWELYRSGNSGLTWTNPYSWILAGVGVDDVDAVVVGTVVYIGYVAVGDGVGDLSDLRVRRAAASTGAIDATYGANIAYDAAPATIEEVALAANTEALNNRIYLFTLKSNDTISYHWDVDTDGQSWTNASPALVTAESGLDATWNNESDTHYLILSYIGNDGTVRVARQSGAWDNDIVEAAYDGGLTRSAVSAWQDTIIVGYADDGTNGIGLRYRISYNGGDTWAVGDIYAPGVGGEPVIIFDVCARGGFGTAGVYEFETGAFDQVWFRKRDGYINSGWDAPVQINDDDVFTSTAIELELNWVSTIDGSSNNHRFGIVYPQPDPTFDRRQHCDGDVDESGAANVADLLAVITAWGACVSCPPSCNADIAPFSGNCDVNVQDLLEVISAWGPCP